MGDTSQTAPVEPLRIAFLGSANWDLISHDFVDRYARIVGDKAEVIPIPFGQYRSLLHDATSPLRNSAVDFCVFCERFEDIADFPFSLFDPAVKAQVHGKLDEYLAVIKVARAHLPGTFLILDLAPVRPLPATLDDASYEQGAIRFFLESLNRKLSEFAKSLPDCRLIRLSTLVESFGAKNADPGKYWHLGRIAYNRPFAEVLSERLIKTLLAIRSKTARVIITDLDNTLWGGVIGDDGIKGIQLGGDFPGGVYVEIQKCMRSLKDRGIALAICSKNIESVALDAIRDHPNMILRVEDFAATKINWKEKTDNIREIAEELGLGLSSICVVDDSPYERESIRRLLPEVVVPELPNDKAEWPAYLLEYPYLATLVVTQEDRERAERYKIRAKILTESATFQVKEDYWRSLNMRLYFHQLNDKNHQRVLQLLAKTNQFNMTTRRHTESDLERLAAEGAAIIPLGLSDKYSAHEVIGLAILLFPKARTSPSVIDTFLLSCRVLGRGVETGVLGWLCRFAASRGYAQLEGLFVETDRNLPARDVYRNHGFVEAGEGRLLFDLKGGGSAIPDWFAISED